MSFLHKNRGYIASSALVAVAAVGGAAVVRFGPTPTHQTADGNGTSARGPQLRENAIETLDKMAQEYAAAQGGTQIDFNHDAYMDLWPINIAGMKIHYEITSYSIERTSPKFTGTDNVRAVNIVFDSGDYENYQQIYNHVLTDKGLMNQGAPLDHPLVYIAPPNAKSPQMFISFSLNRDHLSQPDFFQVLLYPDGRIHSQQITAIAAAGFLKTAATKSIHGNSLGNDQLSAVSSPASN